MYKIIHEVCRAICDCLQDNYINFPQNERDWLTISDGYLREFNSPHSLGSVDIRQFVIDNPLHSGVRLKNRKKKSSMASLGISDAYRRFNRVSIGSYGSKYDSTVFRRNSLSLASEKNELLLPPPRVLPTLNIECPFFSQQIVDLH